MNEIITNQITARLLDENIVENIVHDHSIIDIADIIEIKKANTHLTKGQKYAVLVDSGMITTITKEGRELSASAEFQMNTVAKALFVRSLGHRLVGNLYLRVNKPAIKTQVFNCREKALIWLRTEMTIS